MWLTVFRKVTSVVDDPERGGYQSGGDRVHPDPVGGELGARFGAPGEHRGTLTGGSQPVHHWSAHLPGTDEPDPQIGSGCRRVHDPPPGLARRTRWTNAACVSMMSSSVGS